MSRRECSYFNMNEDSMIARACIAVLFSLAFSIQGLPLKTNEPAASTLQACLTDANVTQESLSRCSRTVAPSLASNDPCALKCSVEAIGVYWACAAVCIKEEASDSCITAGCLASTAAFDTACLKACPTPSSAGQASITLKKARILKSR